jgi:hypothetical protein
MQFGMKNNMFDGIEHPLDRLENIEIIQMGQGAAMLDLGEQLRTHSQLGVSISESLVELVRHIDILNSKIWELEHRVTELESK